MSMISSQCDKLRLIADKDTVPYEASDAMYQAADLILELRDNLQCANEAVQDAEHDESMAWDRVRKAEAENAKLRERIEELESCAVAPPLEEQLLSALDENAKLRKLCKELAEFLTEAEWLQWPELRAEMRELGVEVDG